MPRGRPKLTTRPPKKCVYIPVFNNHLLGFLPSTKHNAKSSREIQDE